MSGSTAQSQEAQQPARKKKRKERSAKSSVPEPKNIVSGAGQPLDLSVRRDLEERLGHDFSQVRLHTDRDADALTGLLGADAVAVGQDIFFREGAYLPGTADGQRLLAHELLHTVQDPHGLGALRAGRDLGAVSLPEQAAEREAESAAQGAVRDEAPEPAADVEQEEPLPGWMRYATVDADRRRMELLDPATLPDRLANQVLRSLRGDPQDASGRVRMQLRRLSPELLDAVLGRLEVRLVSAEYERVLDFAVGVEDELPPLQPGVAPEPVTDLFELLGVEHVEFQRKAEGEKGDKEQRDGDARQESKDAGERNAQEGSATSRAASDAATEDAETAQRQEQEDERARSREQAAAEEQQEDEKQAGQRQQVDQEGEQAAEDRQAGSEEQKEQRKEQRDREEKDPEQSAEPGGEKRKREDDQKKAADGAKPEQVDPKAKGQPGRVRPEKVDERGNERDSALSEHGLHEKDEAEEGEPREEEKPLGLEAGADGEVGGPEEGEQDKEPGGKPEPELKPEDHLPDTDLDLSAVPTADKMKPGDAEPAAPDFPAPPPTKAEKAEREREKEENDPESEEPGAAAEARPPGEDEGPVEGEAPKPVGGPAAEAEDRGAKDLQPEKPTEQEVGPDPETEEKEQQEPEAEKKDPAQQQDADDDAAQAAKRDEAEREKDEDAGGEEKPDAKDAEDEKKDLQDRDQQEKARNEQGQGLGQPQGSAVDKPAGETPSGSPQADPKLNRPAGAHTEKAPVEDKNPSAAARREAEPPKPDREAAAAPSAVPKESGPGAVVKGPVGGSEPAGPTTAAGPGGAPSAAQASVSPAAEPAADPGGAPAAEEPQAKPEASLEKDGGGCAPPEPAPEKEEGKAGCGGGGGAAKEEKKPKPPDVSGQEPKAAVKAVSKLPPDQAAQAVAGVDRAADRKIGEEQQNLAAKPPTRERPSGAPRTQKSPPQAAAPAPVVRGKVERVGEPGEGDKQKAKGGERAEGKKPTDDTPPPTVTTPPAKELSAEDAKNVDAAADAVPTVDPELRNKTVGPAPKIRLEGKSDPKRTDDQAKALKEKQRDIQMRGREDAAKPMGEDQIYPNAPAEQLRGKVSSPGRQRGGALKPESAVDTGVGAVAKEEKGKEVAAGGETAGAGMAAEEKKQKQGEQREKQQKQQEIDRSVQDNAAKQAAQRGETASGVQRARQSWRDEQDGKVKDSDDKAGKEHKAQNKEIADGRNKKDKEVEDRKSKDNEEIGKEREKAEKEAEKKKEEEKPSGGFFGWIADKVKAAFEAILDAVTKVFEAARKLVNGIIDKFKEFANKAIDFVRDLAIKAINFLADALIALGDVLLAAFPGLRDKWRNFINGVRDRAIAAVNALADALKKAVNFLLDALAAGLNALLKVLEFAVKAIIKAYQAVIMGAIKFAQAAIEALGKFAALIKDIAPDPGGWLGKLGSSAKEGVTSYLWPALKSAVKKWFDAKVEGILGLGKAIIGALTKGCVSLKQIGKMAWDAIIASLPMIIISLVIEKLISLIVPAAGAILTIVQGLMAAWQSISSILTAFSKFWAYLRAVKAGPAACLFAEAVAAGAVALLEFIANFLLIRLQSATKGVGKRLKAMAQKIMKGLKKVGKGAKKAAGSAINRARGAMRNAKQALRKPPVRPKPKGKPTPNPKAPPKPKPHPTPKAPPKPQPKPAKPKPVAPRDKTPDTRAKPPKKTKEIEAPKPANPRKPKSPVGSTLNKVKTAVKTALKKVRNAVRALGKKLAKSKLGKALKRGANKVRNAFKRVRTKFRAKLKTRRNNRTTRANKNKKNEKESKRQRLHKAMLRIRPRIKWKTKKGVPDRSFQTMLDGLRRWYRLSSLNDPALGNGRRMVRASLNPGPDDLEDVYEKSGDCGEDAKEERSEVYDEKPEKDEKHPELKSKMKVRAKNKHGKWPVGEVLNLREREFTFFGHGEKGAEVFNVCNNDKTKWDKILPKEAQKFLYGRDFEAIRPLLLWSQYEPDARQTLNYRHHNHFANPASGPYMNWHHIHEQRAAGPNTIDNLVLTTAVENNKYAAYFATKHDPGTSPSGKRFPGTRNKPLRKYLEEIGATPQMHLDWGMRAIEEETPGKHIRKVSYGRGIFQELV
ncbi:eCIS core domain-containing protein [Streptomyces boninensis]|uniref:eCIS core domain-containing protein n=1 Tax=Streptomyces boninensis TaxID=2039455 RepID=UPI003B21880A